MVFIVLLLSGMAPCEASRHASIVLSFLVSFPGTNDPETGGIAKRRAFGSGSRGGNASAEGRSLLCRHCRALIVTAGLAASRWRKTSRAGEAEALPSLKSSHSGPRTVFQITP
ncbi:MAG: hypothetical protein E5X74_15560 [Mesorhizobium sp.]|uniref:hypothetical protein n=1 Tax=Mesorhizobium sp. TaxID=1871066 RepID=UPI0012037EC1|nr:hypothetical protein [Mesorhizobium sp.]TIO74926.1 MAG: hypothetical protein E5X75_21950 [Mesorhizobium sp.]TIO84632.1 MAG: hypothetical protein E5X74_15560 [Mesorhizobium sp.]